MVLKGTLTPKQVLTGTLKKIPEVDKTLTVEGCFPDSKVTGDEIRKRPQVHIGNTPPPFYPAIWFNTDPTQIDELVSLLSLTENEEGYDVQARVGDEAYGVENATVNKGVTDEGYDFTVL